MSTSAANDLYEAYLLTLILRCAHQCGLKITLTPDEPQIKTPARVLHLRRNPGRLYNAFDSHGHMYTHAVIHVPGSTDFGVYAGVQCVGRSGALSEADIVVLPEREARQHALHHESPDARTGDVKVHIEAKLYGGALPIAEARAFAAMAMDFHRSLGNRPQVMKTSIIAAPQMSSPAETFVNEGCGPAAAIADVRPGRPGEQSFQSLVKYSLGIAPILPGSIAVHPGSFCSPIGTHGSTIKGQRLTCRKAKDGRNRWMK